MSRSRTKIEIEDDHVAVIMRRRSGLLPFDAATDVEAATSICRVCRRAGYTPRGMIDCMMAAVAQRHRASMLCRDVDLERICTVIGIELDEASTSQS